MEDGWRIRSLSILNRSFLLFAALISIAQFFTACRTAKPLPTADFSTPGWRIQQGQAVWKPPGNRPELAGDLLLATNANGNFFVQFTKIPFQLVTAEIMDDQWQIEFGNSEYSWQGHGQPSSRFAWFQLPRALLGEKTAGNWRFEKAATNNSWRLENPHTGEYLEGGLFP